MNIKLNQESKISSDSRTCADASNNTNITLDISNQWIDASHILVVDTRNCGSSKSNFCNICEIKVLSQTAISIFEQSNRVNKEECVSCAYNTDYASNRTNLRFNRISCLTNNRTINQNIFFLFDPSKWFVIIITNTHSLIERSFYSNSTVNSLDNSIFLLSKVINCLRYSIEFYLRTLFEFYLITNFNYLIDIKQETILSDCSSVEEDNNIIFWGRCSSKFKNRTTSERIVNSRLLNYSVDKDKENCGKINFLRICIISINFKTDDRSLIFENKSLLISILISLDIIKIINITKLPC